MLKTSFTLMLFLFAAIANSQTNLRYVDSLKKIVKKGLPDDHSEKKQTKYVKACIALGDYFEKENNMKPALFYYEKVSVLSDGCDSDLGENVQAIELRKKLDRKLADIYFYGKGVKKDLQKSIEYAKGGCEGGDKEFEKLSLRYFKCTDIIQPVTDSFNFKKDSLISFTINPFSKYITLTGKLKERYLIPFGNAFKEKNKQDEYKIELFSYGGNSTYSLMYISNVIDNIKMYLIKVLDISENTFVENVEMYDGPEGNFHGYNATIIEIRVVKK